ncbi:Casparian strip membrane protein 4 [Euphorbia peplus]|nr:Casparian strip membrane protein 4 [Euphorbia peplus]
MESRDDDHEIKDVNKVSSIPVLHLILRIFAAIGTLASAITMATSSQTLPFSIQFLQFKAQYNDLPTLTFFVIANSVACGYLFLSISIPLSICHFMRIRSIPKIARIILLIVDMVMLVTVTSGASTAVSTVFLAHEGNSSANWVPICPRFSHFCQRISASVIGSFFSILIFMLIITTSLI